MADRVEELQQQVEALRDRLARQTEATSRITASLDIESVLQGALNSARSLTGARYGLIFVPDDSGQVQHFLTSGPTARELDQLTSLPDGPALRADFLAMVSHELRVQLRLSTTP